MAIRYVLNVARDWAPLWGPILGLVAGYVLFRRAPRRDEKAATRKRLAYEKSIGLGRLQGSLPSVLDMIDAQLDAARQDPPQTDAARMRLKVGGRLKGFLRSGVQSRPSSPGGSCEAPSTI
jgi:hypothetical protein